MANIIIIVSTHCYLLAESINSITIDVTNIDNSLLRKEDPVAQLVNSLKRPGKAPKQRRRGKKAPKPIAKMSEDEYSRKVEATSGFQITIHYTPVSKGQNMHVESQYVQFTVLGYKTAMKAYREVVKQIREQMPDTLFLNELVDRLLEGDGQ